jgi:hypothetical protein
MPTFVRSKRFCHPRLAAALVLVLAAGCSGKLPSAEDLAKVKMGMSLSEVEGILGSGKTPDGDFLDGDKQGQTVRKQWGSGDHWLILTFRNDKLVGYRGHNVPDIGFQDGGRGNAPVPTGRVPFKEHERQPEWDLNALGGNLFGYSVNHNDHVPASLDELKDLPKVHEALYQKLKAGTCVVVWGTDFKKGPVLAYEKDAPTNGGLVLLPKGKVTRMSADQLNALLAKKS